MSDWAEQNQSVILCEGYHDRAFWKGWLTYLGFTDPGSKVGLTERVPVKNPWGRIVAGRGKYVYRSPVGKCIVVAPCEGRDNIFSRMNDYLTDRDKEPLARLVINVDPDTLAEGSGDGITGIRSQDVLDQIRKKVSDAKPNTEGDIEIDNGVTKVCLVRWKAEDVNAPGIPNQQTLERLVCASLAAAYPERGACVQNWLDTRHEPPTKSCVKEYSWSYMAGWHAENGCDDFYCRLWDDEKIVSELRARLEASGAWRIAEALAN